ncbi:leucyl/phenylalanyl-tRNA--protein transferase, partial [Candidatus Symbiopectobacterium sp. NZEC135]|uniref:leucyl/phenylalanyl-tRNA--protein transferase n=1 Tax=Candidatus Symbiopectobacterium sp. NZEC135 TaxID=2820471 RepID=UPI002A05F472|nr:leucyl/phenylalanyl-tRNA--protein transferase [Candidatus Symbiopectobacterium sp. NZEC135]
MQLFQLSPNTTLFPPVEKALADPNGLLAFGGDLSPARVLAAYRAGIFPWYSPGDPILWWSPDPRAILHPEALHISRSLHKFMRKQPFHITLNYAFAAVVHACAHARQEGTWISPE